MNDTQGTHLYIDIGLHRDAFNRKGESSATWAALVGIYIDVDDRRGLKWALQKFTDVESEEQRALLLEPLQEALVKAIESGGTRYVRGPRIAQAFIDHIPGFEEEWVQVDSTAIIEIYKAWQLYIDCAKDPRYINA